jgi:hypothetical protein
MRFFVIALALLLTLPASSLIAQTELVPFGSNWNFLDDGSNQGTTWNAATFNDANWKSGNGSFGYKNNKASTVVSYGTKPNKKHITTYFRKSITISNPADFEQYSARIMRDDGVVVYVNGSEVYRSNLPSGSITYSTLATDAKDNGKTAQVFTISSSAFVRGNNIIAVEIHQSKANSSDLAFDLELNGNTSTPPTDVTPPSVLSINRQSPASETTNATELTYRVTFSEAVNGVDKTDFSLNTLSGSSSGTLTAETVAVGSSGTTYDVTVSSVSGNGSLRLDLKSNGTGIADAAGNTISGGYTSGQSYTIDQTPADNTAPTLTFAGINSSNSNSSLARVNDVVTLSFTASEAIEPPVVTIATHAVTAAPTASNSYTATYTLTSADAAGVVAFSIDFSDLAGNPGSRVTASTNASSVLFDKSAPSVLSINRQSPASETTSATELTYRVTFSEAVNGVDKTDFSLNTLSGSSSGTLTAETVAVGSSGTTYDVTVSSVSGNGSLRLDLKSSGTGIADAAGNTISGGYTSGQSYVVETIQQPAPGSDITLVPYNSSWKYLDDGSNQGTAWQANSYSDASWKSGNGKFGYGISDAATVVSYGSNSSNKYITTYFRKTVDIADADGFSSYTINVKRDDGVVVYVNGTEVLRNNMPTGPIAYNTLANVNVSSDNGTTPQSFVIDGSAFSSGTNIISAEIHQSNVTSPDIAFDLELMGQVAYPPTALKVVTWNTYYFGADQDSNGNTLGPVDNQLQYDNVKKAMLWLKADIFALQEVSNDAMMEQLISELPGYSFVRSEAYSFSVRPSTTPPVPIKLYVVYRTDKISIKKERPLMQELYAKIISNEVILDSYPGSSSSAAKNDDSFWNSGQLPYLVEMEATVNGLTQPIHLVNIHAAPGKTSTNDYERRKYDVQVLKDSLDTNYASDNLILLGDYNDDVDVSLSGLTSPYKPYVDDEQYQVLTYELSLAGYGTYNSGTEFKDHITILGQNTGYMENSIKINDEIRNYINRFYSTTSDHLPVSAQFNLAAISGSYKERVSASINKEYNKKADAAETADMNKTATVAAGIFPNPTDGQVSLFLPADEAFLPNIKLSIWSVQGSKLLETVGSQHKVHQQMQENVMSAPKGIYIVEVIAGSNKYQMRLVKK